MDDIVTEDEIKEAIHESITMDKQIIELRARRPAYGDTQNITVIMPAFNAI